LSDFINSNNILGSEIHKTFLSATSG